MISSLSDQFANKQYVGRDRIQSRNLHSRFAEGQEDFKILPRRDLQQNPELGYTDEQVEAEVQKMTEEEKSLYSQIKDFTDTFYRQHGYIIPWVISYVCT